MPEEAVQKFVSQEPEDFVPGGLLSDVDVLAESFRACYYDYSGSISEPVVAIRGILHQLDKDGKVIEGQKPQEQYWSFGSASDYAVSEGGLGIIAIGTAEAGRQNSNWHIMAKSLRDAGMPKGFLKEGRFDVLDKLVFHCAQVPAPKRPGLEQPETNAKGYAKTVLIAQKILAAPWLAKGPARRSAAAAAAPTSAPAAPVNGPVPVAAAPVSVGEEDTNAIAKRVLDELLAKNNGIMERNVLKMDAFRALGTAKAATRNAVVAMLSDDAFLTAQGCTVQPDAVMRA